MAKPQMKRNMKNKTMSTTKNSLKSKKEKSSKTATKLDPEEAIAFGPWKIPTQRKNLVKIFKKRQGALEKGFCVFCCECLDRVGITKDYLCPNCKKSLLDCFVDGKTDKNISLLERFKVK